MSCLKDVMSVGKKLEKMTSKDISDHAAALDLLNQLKKQKMTLDVLQKTRIGMIVNNFRKSSTNDEVITLAKALIKSWKKLLSGDSSSQSSSSVSISRSSSVASKDDDNSQDGMSKDTGEESGQGDNKPEIARQNSFSSKATETSDGIRLKCRELLTNALKCSNPPEEFRSDFAEVGALIEDAIFKEFQNTDMKYKNRVRSRVANLKDAKNPKLRENVLLGYIKPEEIASMTAEQMANDAMKTLRAKYTKESIDDHQMAQTSGTTTDLLKCGKCSKRNCTYNQVQTRSADEPMTTFVLCNNCGHRWKFC